MGERTAMHDSVLQAGYYPDLVSDVLDLALGSERVAAYLVHPETTFDAEEVRRHLTVLVLTDARLIVAHVDDHGDGREGMRAIATTESVPVGRIHTVALTHVVTDPASYKRGDSPQEVTLALAWGAINRVDLEPATCGDRSCDAEHGFTGTTQPDDLLVRVAADAEGEDAVGAAVSFARTLTESTSGTGRAEIAAPAGPGWSSTGSASGVS